MTPTITSDRIFELWAQSNYHFHRFVTLLLKELYPNEQPTQDS